MSTPALFRRHRIPLPPSPITLLSLNEMVARIEAIRLEETPEPTCPTCGSTADPGELKAKWCWCCRTTKTRSQFNRNRTKPDGRHDSCRECDRQGRKQRRSEEAIRLLGRSA
jgi:hypothetical protein